MNKTYMQDVLGISNTSTQQKMNLLIQEANKNVQDFNNFTVYAWGKNDKGQLCTNPSANINNPVKMKLAQNTELLSCFGDQTLLRNIKSGEVTVNSLDEQGKLHWQHVTSDKIWYAAGNKSSLIYIQSVTKKKLPQAMCEEPVHLKKEKLRTAKNIIDQIQWDSNLQQEEFAVGYQNRYEGTLECNFI